MARLKADVRSSLKKRGACATPSMGVVTQATGSHTSTPKRGRPRGSGTVLKRIAPDLIRKYAYAKLTLNQAAAAAGVHPSSFHVAAQPFIQSHGIDRFKLAFKSKVNAAEAQALYEAGWTLAMLGARYGVTRERVRQMIDTAVPTRPPTYSRTCQKCGGKFVGLKRSRFCSSCRKASLYDLCACGRRKQVVSAQCANCGRRRNRFSWSLAAKLYLMGYGLLDISRSLRATRGAIYYALHKQGVRPRSRHMAERVAKATRNKEPIEAAIKRTGGKVEVPDPSHR